LPLEDNEKNKMFSSVGGTEKDKFGISPYSMMLKRVLLMMTHILVPSLKVAYKMLPLDREGNFRRKCLGWMLF
jgi:hypothetical protein